MGNVSSDYEDEQEKPSTRTQKKVAGSRQQAQPQYAQQKKPHIQSQQVQKPYVQQKQNPYIQPQQPYIQQQQKQNPYIQPQQPYIQQQQNPYVQPQQVQNPYVQPQQVQNSYIQQQQPYVQPPHVQPQAQYVNRPPPHAFPQFPNRIHRPTEEMVQQFHNHQQPQHNQIMAYPTSSASYMYDDRTLDTLIERPLPNIELQKHNFHDRIEEYRKNYQKEEEDFEKHEKDRRSKFKSYMERKREKLQQEIRKFEENYNPYEILGLTEGDLEISNIRKAYKKMALKYHPDKAGKEHAEHFEVITQSYIYLLKRAEDYAQSKKNHVDNDDVDDEASFVMVKNDPKYDLGNKIAERFQKKSAPRKPKHYKETNIRDYMGTEDDGKGDIMDVNQNHFDIKKFNSLFEKYKVEEEHEKSGYGDILKSGLGDDGEGEDEKKIFNANMNKEIFNAHFDEMKRKKGGGGNKDPILPDAYDSSSRVSCAQIGQTSNFSAHGKYTDIKQAYFEDNVLIDPAKVQSRKDYRNLQELENERSRVSYMMDPESERIYRAYEENQKREEEERNAYLRNRDDQLRAHHNYTSRKLLVNGKKVQ